MAWFCWGSGGSGCLLLGDLDDFDRPQECALSLSTIVCGGCHCLTAGEDKTEVSAWGDNRFGQCGQPSEKAIVQVPTVIPQCQKVLNVACGWRHSLFLFDNGRVGSCGHKSVIGRPADSNFNETIGYIDIPADITAIFCGYDHSAAIDSSNRLWLWGSNKFGQIGVPETGVRVDRPVLSHLPANHVPETVVCGLRHSAVLTGNGCVLTVGNNRFGQLGRTTKASYCSQWNSIELQEDVRFKALSSGWSHCLALSSKSTVWAWGRGDFGQQGDGSTNHHPYPHMVLLSKAIETVCCGSEHSVCISDCRTDAFVFGWNEHGNLGLGDHNNRLSPVLLTFNAGEGVIAKFAAGGAACFAYIK